MTDLSVRKAGEEPKIPPFPAALLGYQRRAVDRYLKGLIESKATGSQVLGLRPDAILPAENLNRYQDLGREIGELLSAVQQTATAIKEQAEMDAAQWRGEATIEVQKRIAEAQTAAEELRAAAWEVSTQMIVQIQEVERDAYRSIRKHSQEVLAEAENESHRIREDARRRAEAIRSNAHVESLEVEERTRNLCDQMIESAEQQVSAIQERVLALERHRDQLLEEIGGIRSGVAPIGVKLVDQTGGLIYPSTPAEEAPSHVTPQHEMSGLVKVISPTGESEDVSPQDSPGKTSEQTTTGSTEEKVKEEPTKQLDSPVHPDFEDLFASLREISVPVPGPAVGGTEASRPPMVTHMGKDEAVELREAMLLPISNQFVRLFKRLLTEEQNRVLEGIRTSQLNWGEEEVSNRLRSHLEMLAEQSWQAGHGAAERMAGRSIPRPGMALEEEPGFTSRLVADVNEAIDLQGEEGDTPRSLMVSRMFRVWRSERLERHLQELSEKYYEQGLAESLEAVGASK